MQIELGQPPYSLAGWDIYRLKNIELWHIIWESICNFRILKIIVNFQSAFWKLEQTNFFERTHFAFVVAFIWVWSSN